MKSVKQYKIYIYLFTLVCDVEKFKSVLYPIQQLRYEPNDNKTHLPFDTLIQINAMLKSQCQTINIFEVLNCPKPLLLILEREPTTVVPISQTLVHLLLSFFPSSCGHLEFIKLKTLLGYWSEH